MAFLISMTSPVLILNFSTPGKSNLAYTLLELRCNSMLPISQVFVFATPLQVSSQFCTQLHPHYVSKRSSDNFHPSNFGLLFNDDAVALKPIG